MKTQTFGQVIPVAWNMTEGTNVSVVIFFNDVPCCNSSVFSGIGGTCDCLISDPGSFDPDGVVDIHAVAWNLVSNTSDTIQVKMLKRIVNVSISMLTSYSDFGSGVKGRGNLRNVFPAEYPVRFNSSCLDGHADVAEWTFICSSGVTKETKFFFDKSFPSGISQRCDIILVLKNNVSAANATRTIELLESILFTSMTNNGPVKTNQTMTITISLEKFGSNSCMVVDMDDNSSLLVFGEASCAQTVDVSRINLNIIAEPRLTFAKKDASTRQIVIHHRYLQLGTYVVKMKALNYISKVEEETVAVVLDYGCENPNVTITGTRTNINLRI